MKVVILAGGFGTRISEESHLKPKPMIEIGGMPILWHIMKTYSYYGYNDFVICCGYKGYVIKEYFANYYLHRSDITFDFTNANKMTIHNNIAEPWKVTLIETGLNTMTGGRVKRVSDYVGNEPFMLTYGDGVCDIEIDKLVDYHKSHGKIATITAIQPGGRFGVLGIDNDNRISNFKEKSKQDGGWINGGFMVLNPEIMDYIDNDSTVLENYPLEKLAELGEIKAYKHDGFWQCMDTLRDKILLEELLEKGQAPWRVW
ncbi:MULTISPECIES: glucose-1-phosphate cytidylyltransferase [unclassified Paenibacillus]|uniref:glucose-1-phosphate cytidylyltransferase n=1 Tax=unclassified Paenibacillus TaxID=185978 RepID=UPI00240757E3|nr:MULTISPECIES: glucose-1-phosphate cytidylyltransferase [unclassified Paenibacillus]MDF9844043.1 glucose-1-phosphate cytidylyltransferase [Paenibacillus sp. PastF-2]MDF9850648.1 glucose-1-phosphate cytidylyltransferase [Paenibacillus sp. PastM-2]MDF9857201.1 glucose-1-phosphate cytidylyltransferase [Paenibacillus sp. PastF-1]MDH6482498.1 glucose-1-phosphate cytidylyltransferase [Paenibacillus sp. PastH-2]MDH6509899.1 glucose-1-phosphate cytidylyltransferase [Paenibacillus sp. PastM-3]